MPYDLFISYSRQDNEQLRVLQLVQCLNQDFEKFAGRPLRPFFDLHDIQGMDDWQHRILDGLRQSQLMLVCISPNYLGSEYCEWEFNEYLSHEIAHGYAGNGVAPIYFENVPGWTTGGLNEFPAPWIAELRRRQHVDLRSWPGAQPEEGNDPEARLEFQRLAERIADRILRREQADRALGNIEAHNSHFIGRSVELRRLREMVALGKVGSVTVTHGLGGIGKTALAMEYAHVFASDYGGGCWQIRCEGRDDLPQTIATLAPRLRIQLTDVEKTNSEMQFQRTLAELQHLAETHEPHHCLLILDNVDQRTLLEPAQLQRLPHADWLHILVTTRLGPEELFGIHNDRTFIGIDELSANHAVELIESYQPGGRFSDQLQRAAAEEIVWYLNGFTLAVETVAVFLGQFAYDVSCADFLERLKTSGLHALEGAASETSEGVRHGEKLLSLTLRPTLERLSKAEKLALTCAALLPSDQIALPWIRALVGQEYPELISDSQPGRPDPWRAIQRRLFSLRLWQMTELKDANGEPLVVRMHQLLQALVRDYSGDVALVMSVELLAHLKERAKFFWDGWEEKEHRWELTPLVSCAWQWLEINPKWADWFAARLGVPLMVLGNYGESERLQRRCLEKMDPEDPNYTTRLGNLASLLYKMRRFTEAESLLREALTIDERRLGSTDPKIATGLNNLAAVLMDTYRLAEAEVLMRKALRIDELLLGPDHPDVARDLNNLAALLGDTNRFKESETFSRRALAIVERSLGARHPRRATYLNNLSRLLKHTNRSVEAESLAREALSIYTNSLGPDHPEVATSLNNLANLLSDANRDADAESMLRRALEIYQNSFGTNHQNVALVLTSLGSLLVKAGRLAEAASVHQRAYEIYVTNLGDNHPHVANALEHQSAVLRAANQLKEAERLVRRALAIYENNFGKNSPEVAKVLTNLAVLIEEGQRFDAEQALWKRETARREMDQEKRDSDTAPPRSIPSPGLEVTQSQPQDSSLSVLDEDVMFTVYGPKTIAPRKWYSLLAFAHLSHTHDESAEDFTDPIAEVQRQAEQILTHTVRDYKAASQESAHGVPRAGEITFQPFIEGIEFNPPNRSFRWHESVHREEFKLRVRSSYKGRIARGWLRIYLGPIMLAQVNISIIVDSRHIADNKVASPTKSSARPLRKIFASYSHHDEVIVEQIEALVRSTHLGIEFLRDATKLRAGDEWNTALMRMIEEADLFQLFWSQNSMRSQFVRQEYQHALSLGRPSFVLPVYWELPFPENREEGLPPAELKRLHFEYLTPVRAKDTGPFAHERRVSSSAAISALEAFRKAQKSSKSGAEGKVLSPLDTAQAQGSPLPQSGRRRISWLRIGISVFVPIFIVVVGLANFDGRFLRFLSGIPEINVRTVVGPVFLIASILILAIEVLLCWQTLRNWVLKEKRGWQRHTGWIAAMVFTILCLVPLITTAHYRWELFWLRSFPQFGSLWLTYAWVRFLFLRSFKS